MDQRDFDYLPGSRIKDGRYEMEKTRHGSPHPKLWRAADIRKAEAISPALTDVLDWLEFYVVKPHTQLGRTGVVCPFVPPALKLGSLWVSAVDTQLYRVEQICQVLREYLTIYQSAELSVPPSSELKTLIIAFPRLPRETSSELVDRAHQAMKPMVVEKGLMLGEFHPDSISPGLHNPHFYPLRSPMPLFVFRQMVPNDLVFLNKPSDTPAQRCHFIRAYLSVLKGRLSAESVDEALRALAAVE